MKFNKKIVLSSILTVLIVFVSLLLIWIFTFLDDDIFKSIYKNKMLLWVEIFLSLLMPIIAGFSTYVLIKEIAKWNFERNNDTYPNNLFKLVTFLGIITITVIISVCGVYKISVPMYEYSINFMNPDKSYEADIPNVLTYVFLIMYSASFICFLCSNRAIQYANNLLDNKKIKVSYIFFHLLVLIISLVMLSTIGIFSLDVKMSSYEAVIMAIAIFSTFAGASLFNLLNLSLNHKLVKNKITDRMNIHFKYLFVGVSILIISLVTLGYFYYTTHISFALIWNHNITLSDEIKPLIGFYFLIMFTSFASSWMLSIYSKLCFKNVLIYNQK
ncbi:hypothetical protein ACX1NB_00530 [Mycoplasma sp. HF14]